MLNYPITCNLKLQTTEWNYIFKVIKEINFRNYCYRILIVIVNSSAYKFEFKNSIVYTSNILKFSIKPVRYDDFYIFYKYIFYNKYSFFKNTYTFLLRIYNSAILITCDIIKIKNY